MITPRHPVKPPFENARDAKVAWRQEQLAALTQDQRRLYDQARRNDERREKAKAKELEDRKQADIQERMRTLLLTKARLELKLAGARDKYTAAQIKSHIERYFQAGRPQEPTLINSLIRQAEHRATEDVRRVHAQEMRDLQDQNRERADASLRRFETQRAVTREAEEPQKRQERTYKAFRKLAEEITRDKGRNRERE